MTTNHTRASGNHSRRKNSDSYSADTQVDLTLEEETFESLITLHSPRVNHLDKFMSGLGHYLRLQRENQNFTIKDLSYKSGVPQDIIIDLESGDFTEMQVEPSWIYKLAHALSNSNNKKRDQIVSNIKLFTNRLKEVDPYESPYDLVIHWIKSLTTESHQAMQVAMLIAWLKRQKQEVNSISETIILLASIAIAVESVNSANRLPAQFDTHSVKPKKELSRNELIFMSEYDIVKHWIKGFGEYSNTLKTIIKQGRHNGILVGQMLLDWSELSLFPEVSSSLPVGKQGCYKNEAPPQMEQRTTEAIERIYGS